MYLGEQFAALESEKQWAFVLGLPPEQKAKVLIELDNDATLIWFNDGETDNTDDNEPVYYHFKDYIGRDEGAYHLIAACGLKVQGV